jgi:hypothetical protein
MLAGKTRKRRIAAVVVALLAVYSVALRSTPEEPADAVITIAPALTGKPASGGGFTVLAMWRLTARNGAFGGYSALLVEGERLRLLSDQGMWLTIPRPGTTVMHVRGALAEFGDRTIGLRDIESATRDPRTGRFWVGYEHRHAIARYGPDGTDDGEVFPAFAADWYANGGMEAMVRLADGRFIVLRETGDVGVLYQGDPVAGASWQSFPVTTPGGFSITDMAELPDGRLLLVLRKIALHMPPLEGMLAIADPAAIDPATPWTITPLVRIEDLLPRDNYEAVAVEPGDNGDFTGDVTVWLASDDNMSILQQSLLARLSFTPPARIAD